MTKGKLVLAFIIISFTILDSFHIYTYGSPFIDRPTGMQIVVGCSLFICIAVLFIWAIAFIVSNWEEPIKAFRKDTYGK